MQRPLFTRYVVLGHCRGAVKAVYRSTELEDAIEAANGWPYNPRLYTDPYATVCLDNQYQHPELMQLREEQGLGCTGHVVVYETLRKQAALARKGATVE